MGGYLLAKCMLKPVLHICLYIIVIITLQIFPMPTFRHDEIYIHAPATTANYYYGTKIKKSKNNYYLR